MFDNYFQVPLCLTLGEIVRSVVNSVWNIVASIETIK